MKLKISEPKTIEDLKKNLEHLSERIIGKDITKDTVSVSDTSDLTTTETADPGGADEDMINHLKADITSLKTTIDSLVTQFNLLLNNVKGQ